SSGNWVRVASLDAVPTDGRPVRFPVIAKRTDAWSAYPPEPIGSVYLRRTAEGETPVAHTTVCPHLGCSVDYRPAQDCFLCPCHNSEFTVEGARTDPEESPSPRDMDTVEVKIENGQVLVDYRNFKGGVEAKVEE
ncbi:MAG: Rieske (2Fe-2S) protein, partial [Planctomycetota bacterium]